MSEYDAGQTDRIEAERRDIDSYWEKFEHVRHDDRWPVAPVLPVPHLSFEDAIKICTISPQELDAIAKMEKDLMAKLDRANKIDRLKAELRLKAEELRASEEEQAFRDSPNEPLTNEELDVMLDKMNRDYMAAKQAEEGTEARTYPQKLNPHE